MIALSIIGILVGFAIPSVTRQVAKAQVSRVYQELTHYQTPIELLLLDGGQPGLTGNIEAAVNFVDSDISSVTFGNFANPASSTITATFDERASSFIHGTTLTLSRDANGSWTCTIVGGGPAWDDRVKPSACN